MSVRALRARVILDETLAAQLVRTHRVFNERLPAVIGPLFAMRRGEVGPTPERRELYRRIGLYITNHSAQNADYLLNSVSIRGWKPGTARGYKAAAVATRAGEVEVIEPASWVDQAAALSAAGELVFDKDVVHGDLPGCMRQQLGREAVAIISGHDELTVRWHEAHAAWLRRKQEWEADPEHQKYLALKPRFAAFEESVGGQATKRRGRWHLYLDFLRTNPDLAAWRGGPAVVRDLDDVALARVRRARPSRRRSVEAEEFWKVNEELRALDRLHGYHEREFVRRRKTKRNPDGFDHRPTFTMPDAFAHPRWFVFNAPQTNPSGWRNLVLPASPDALGSVELQLLTGEPAGDKYPAEWLTVRFRADPRLARIRRTTVKTTVLRGAAKGEQREKPGYEWYDDHLRLWRPATLSGIKLILDFRPDRTARAAHLVFTCDVESLPHSDLAKLTRSEATDQVTRSGKRRYRRNVPDGLVALAVDLGMRHVGFAALGRFDGADVRLLRSRAIHLDEVEQGGRHPGRASPGPDLAHLARHKRELRRLRRLRGKPVSGESSHVGLQRHIDHMADDRFKKAARAIVNLALNADGAVDGKTALPYPRADVIVLEKLENLVPDAERERGINRALVAFNRGHLVQRVRELAEDVGLKVFEVSPVGTSQVCHRCGGLGRRYSIVREAGTPGAPATPVIRFGEVEALFACPACRNDKGTGPFTCNADHNAARNLLRRFVLDDAAVAAYLALDRAGRRRAAAAIEERLRPELERSHALPGAFPEPPW